MAKKKCFIIMPITTPSDLVHVYSEDEDHFKHVLDHLFIPAINKLDIEPIAPIAKGAEVIHAEIINNIEKSDFVLCDMSILNPNVFFELGIRTAINKPVTLIKDDATPKVPFDTNLINNHTYSHKLDPWALDTEIENLTEHLKNCFDGTQAGNSLWQYFSLSARAETLHEPSSRDQKIDFLTMQVAALRKDLQSNIGNEAVIQRSREKTVQDELFRQFMKMVSNEQGSLNSASFVGNNMTINPSLPLSPELEKRMKAIAKEQGIDLEIKVKAPVKS